VKDSLQLFSAEKDDRTIVVVGDKSGVLYEYTGGGDADVGELVSVGFSSKWVTASIILKMQEEGLLSLTDTPSKYLPFWSNDGGLRSQITLRQLLSCTSGLGKEHECVGNDQYDSLFACAEQIHAANTILPFAPGTTFYYSGNNDVVLGAMALKAAGVSSWNLLLDRYVRQPLDIRKESLFYLPHNNPSLSEGLFTSTSLYVEFLSEFYNRFIANRISSSSSSTATITINYSPVHNSAYRYSLGHWSSAGLIHIHPSSYFYPLIDQANDYYVVVKTSTSSAQLLMDSVRPSIASAIQQGRTTTNVNVNVNEKEEEEEKGKEEEEEEEEKQENKKEEEGEIDDDDDEDENILTSDSQILRAKATIALVGTFVLLTILHLAAN